MPLERLAAMLSSQSVAYSRSKDGGDVMVECVEVAPVVVPRRSPGAAWAQ